MKNPFTNAGDLSSVSGLGRSPGVGNSSPLQYSSEKAMAPHSSTLTWKIPWTEEPGRLRPWGRWGSDTTEWLYFHFSLSFIGEGNGNPLQCSCLENPRDWGAWWAAVSGVAQSWTQLKWLSSLAASILAWKIPWQRNGGIQSMGLQRVRHDWAQICNICILAYC